MALKYGDLVNLNDEQKKKADEVEKYIDNELMSMANPLLQRFSIVSSYDFLEPKVIIELKRRYRKGDLGWGKVIFKERYSGGILGNPRGIKIILIRWKPPR